jgi:hypothetical protein
VRKTWRGPLPEKCARQRQGLVPAAYQPILGATSTRRCSLDWLGLLFLARAKKKRRAGLEYRIWID